MCRLVTLHLGRPRKLQVWLAALAYGSRGVGRRQLIWEPCIVSQAQRRDWKVLVQNTNEVSRPSPALEQQFFSGRSSAHPVAFYRSDNLRDVTCKRPQHPRNPNHSLKQYFNPVHQSRRLASTNGSLSIEYHSPRYQAAATVCCRSERSICTPSLVVYRHVRLRTLHLSQALHLDQGPDVRTCKAPKFRLPLSLYR